MSEVWLLAAVWIGLALLAVLIAIKLHISTALSEIVVGTVAQLIIGAFVGATFLGAWLITSSIGPPVLPAGWSCTLDNFSGRRLRSDA